MKWLLAASLSLLSGCATGNFPGHNISVQQGELVACGKLFFEFGDRVDMSCTTEWKSGDILLIRDEKLQSRIVNILGNRVLLKVRQVDACHGPDAYTATCLHSGDGLAYRIVEWIRPK